MIKRDAELRDSTGRQSQDSFSRNAKGYMNTLDESASFE